MPDRPTSTRPLVELLVACSLLLAPVVSAAADAVDFESGRWAIERGEVVTYLGQKALRGGHAVLKGVELGDGVIEVDVAVDGSRSFPGIQFRTTTGDDYETVYLRPHKSKQPDALQYTPVWNGNSCWQLYNGRGFTAAAEIPTGRFVHVKLELSGSRARVFFDSMERPALVIDDLRLGNTKGGLALDAPPGPAVHFANFSYREAPALDFGPLPKRSPLPGRIVTWQLSRQLRPDQVDRFRPPPEQQLGDLLWQQVEADAQGLLDITRHVDKDPNAVAVILARTILQSNGSEVKRLTFGYSDLVSVFLNGRLLYSGDSSFLRRDDMFAGTVGLNDDLYLPLEPGDNELLLVVTDGLGGWGLEAQLRPLPAGPVALAAGVSKRWELTEGLRNPETVLVDRQRGVLYVSNANLMSRTAEPAGFLSRIRLDGTVDNLEWVTGLARPLGMALVGDRLLVVERTGVAEVDVVRGAIVARHPIAPAGMLNDIAVAPDGTTYVSDSRASTVFRLRDGTAEPWLSGERFDGANGLLVEGGQLVVACSRAGTLVFVDRGTGKVEEIVEVPGMLDGLESAGEGRLIVSDYGGFAYLVAPNGERTALVDTSEAGLSCANLAFDPASRLLAVPMLPENRLAVYEVVDTVR